MASTKRKKSGTSGKKRTAAKGKSSKKSGKKDQSGLQEKTLRNEVILLMVLAISVVLMVCNFDRSTPVLSYIGDFMFGMFGIFAYIVPVLFFFGTAFMISNGENEKARIKVLASVIFFVLLCTLTQLLWVKFDNSMLLQDYYIISSKNRAGGGLVGGLIGSGLCTLIGVFAAYVVVFILMIISLILITEKSFFGGIKNSSSKMYQSAKEDMARMRENNTARANERKYEKEKRMNNKVKGVVLDTKLPVPDTLKEDVHEITKEFVEPDVFQGHINLPQDEETITIETPAVEEVVPPKRPVKRPKEEPVAELPVEPVQSQNEEDYVFPPMNLLAKGVVKRAGNSERELKETAYKLQQTLQNFGVGVTVTNVSCGPAVTRYELQPEQGVKVSRIVALSDDIKLNLAAADIRIEAPIPGKAAVGIEVPNKENSAVFLRDLLESEEYQKHSSPIAFAAGRDISGQVVVTDIAKMPHLLIAGATGSGKSVCINTLIMSILYKSKPSDVKLILIDPKVVELSVYNGIPHLMIPVVTDPKKAAGALNWAVAEMSTRYKKFADFNVRDLKGYNDKVASVEHIEEEGKPEKLPQIVIIVDELADLMMTAAGEVEDAICRLAQLARAAGIHLVIATQRPSVNVITGLIKANVPSRIAFSVASGVDSRTILDMNGAEKLLGKGDMLFYPAGYQKPVRVQGAFVSDQEVSKVVSFLTEHTTPVSYNEEVTAHIDSAPVSETVEGSSDRDVYFVDAGRFIIEKDKASIGMLQRVYKIGFNRAARIMDQLAEAGVVGEEEGTKPRKVLMTMEEFDTFVEEYI